MQTIERLADRLVNAFMPKVQAEALYVWQILCLSSPQCSQDQQNWYPTKVKAYCHDGSGQCTSATFIGCCY